MSGTPCFQCGEDTGTKFIQDRGQNSYCMPCWNSRVVSRIKKRLIEVSRSSSSTSTNVFAPAEKALIFLDGSTSSIKSNSALALINLCYQAQALNSLLPNNPRAASLPFPFTFSVLVVLEDDSFGDGGGGGVSPKNLSLLVEWLSKLPGIDRIPVYTAILGDALHESPTITRVDLDEGSINSRTTNNGQRHDLAGVVSELKSKTSQNDFLRVLRSRLLGSVAKKLGIRTVLLSDSQTLLGSNMFSLMALGRGSQLANQMALSSPWNGLTLCRILMDFSDAELTQYLSTLEFKDPLISNLMQGGEGEKNKEGHQKSQKVINSLDGQCLDFIGNLQVGYPSTVSTLTRIGSKLAQVSSVEEGQGCDTNLCAFCKSSVEQDLEGTVIGWCYGCSVILKEMKNPRLLQDLV